MHGYPQFYFGMRKALAESCFLRIVLKPGRNNPALVGSTHRKPDAQNVCAVIKVGTALLRVVQQLILLQCRENQHSFFTNDLAFV